MDEKIYKALKKVLEADNIAQLEEGTKKDEDCVGISLLDAILDRLKEGLEMDGEIGENLRVFDAATAKEIELALKILDARVKMTAANELVKKMDRIALLS